MFDFLYFCFKHTSHRNEAIFGSFFDLPDSDEVEDILTMATREKNPISEVNEILNETHRMTLHVVNVREYQVLSLMDKTKFAEPFGGADFTSRDTDMNIYGYGWDAKKKLYGVPPEGSPYYKNFTTRDFETREWDWEEELPKGVEEFEISGDIRISFHRYWKEWEVEVRADYSVLETLRFSCFSKTCPSTFRNIIDLLSASVAFFEL